MTATISNVKTSIEKSLELLNKEDTESKNQDYKLRLDDVRRIIIRNEKKIWLRTKKGKEMISDLDKVSRKLQMTLSTQNEYHTIEDMIHDLEGLMKAIEEESRKRNMVVT
jgi:hypothetical protein